MKEFVAANGRIFECENVNTGIDSVTIIFATLNEGAVECVNAATEYNPKKIVLESRNADEIETLFRSVTEMIVSFGKYKMPEEDFAEENEKDLILEEPHGFYEEPQFSLSFESVTKFEDGTLAVTMHIKSEIERQLDALKKGQKLQDEAIIELAGMVGGEA